MPYFTDCAQWWRMMSSFGNIFRVIDPMWGESTGHRWMQSLNVLINLCLKKDEQTIETPVIWDAIALILTSL